MARGITEKQVHAAADAVVSAGERPTVERIRAHLGTGSPNTVTRHLDSWWVELGARLEALVPRVALPDAPDAVQRLAGELWTQAVAAARDGALAELAGERDALEQARAALASDQARDSEAIAAATQARESADRARQLAEARLAETQRRADQLQAQVADLTDQRTALAASVERLEDERRHLREQLQAERSTLTQERESNAAYVRAVEDRAHAEVDLARKENRDLRAQLRSANRERAAEQAASREASQTVQEKLAVLQRELATQTGRAEALERQLLARTDQSSRRVAKRGKAARKSPASPAPRPKRGKSLA